MSDNQPFRDNSRHLAFLVLPCLSLTLTLAAFCLGAPVKLARIVHGPTPVLAGLEFDATIRYEPAVSVDLSDFQLIGAKRVLDGLVSGHLVAFK